MTKIFFDTEFTGLHQATTLVSIGLIAESGETFYAELTDYDKSQVDDWIQENVINKLYLTENDNCADPKEWVIKSETNHVRECLRAWFKQFDKVQMWSDCLSYDWVLFCNIFDSAWSIPQNIYYIPFDLSTILELNGIDPDISREKFAFGEVYAEMIDKKHNALWDAKVIKACFDKVL